MFIAHIIRRIVALLAVLGLLLGPLQPIVRAQDTGRVYLPVVNRAPFLGEELLFRTQISVPTSVHWRDLERIQPVILERGDDWALLLVDDLQLADLARLRFDPAVTDSLPRLITVNQAADPVTASSLQPLISQAHTYAAQLAQADTSAAPDMAPAAVDAARATLRATLAALTAEQQDFLALAVSADADNDGLTDDQEAWWCTNLAVADTDFDGANDGAEVTALREWVGNANPNRLRAGPPESGQPFLGWPPDNPGCLDNDRDSIPNLAELYHLGLNPAAESTDRDQFDDGQEVFGTTNCPGSGTGCGYGSLPPASNDPGVVLFPEMPGWVKAPGNHPLVAGLPVMEIDIVPDSLQIQLVTTVTTEKGEMSQATRSYSTAKTEGTSKSESLSTNWSDWEETTTTTPLAMTTDVKPEAVPVLAIIGGIAATAKAVQQVCKAVNYFADDGCKRGAKYVVDKTKPVISDGWKTIRNTATNAYNQTKDWIDKNVHLNSCSLELPPQFSCAFQLGNQVDESGGAVNRGAYSDGASDPVTGLASKEVYPSNATPVHQYFPMSYPPLQPTRSETTGRSWGGSQTTTHETYEEHTVTNGEAFTTGTDWSTATAVNSAHAANLTFGYTLINRGNDFARKICDIAFNVYIGDSPAPVITYDLGSDLGGDGCLRNFRPGGTPVARASRAIPLSLDQVRAIDTGAPFRVVLSRFALSTEDYYAEDAASRGLAFALEDGTDDGDETIDTYIIPTWKSGEHVLNVLARFFPHRTDANGMLTAIWTPEYRSDTPTWCREPKRPVDYPTKALWCKHDLSTADWWNVYTDGLGDGGDGFQDTPAVPGGVALFRFNQDSDHDGFSDRSEAQLGTDPNDASSAPYPELLAGVHQLRAGTRVTATLSLLNTGFYDAYGVEAVMVAPDDSIRIENNTVGGSGRVRSQKQVIVGSRLLPQTPLPAPWTQSGHASPAVGGYYTGDRDRTYTFTVTCPAGGCSVGSGTWSMAWSDGLGGSGTLNFGSGYKSPTFLPVSRGVTLALYSGTVQGGDSFTVAAQTPRDTFQYTIQREPFTPPLVIVSYNDPQGNHRFVIPAAAMNLAAPTDNLQQFAGQMLEGVGVDLVTHAAATPGSNSLDLLVNNPSDSALDNARLFLEIINLSGTVVSEVPSQVDLPPGPTYVNTTFNTNIFNPSYQAGAEYIVMAFLTDYQGNILDTSGRPLASFQVDPRPELEYDAATLTWNFGSVPQGTLLKHPLALANTGFAALYTYLSPAPGLSLARGPADTVGAADLTDYLLILRTAELGQGAYDRSVTLRTSDPDQPSLTVRIQGTVTAPTGDIPGGGIQRPLDVPVTVIGPSNAGDWVNFSHSLGPDGATLHPVKVYDSGYGALQGVGAVATDFGAGTASAEMFGDGRDGVMPGSGNLDNNNGFGVGSVNGTQGATSISVTDRYGVGRINPGDVVLIHQTRGSGAGQWELNKAADDFTGSGTFTLQTPLKYSYVSNGGNEKAQILRVPQYTDCNVTGTVTPLAAWNGDWGGIFAVMCNDGMTVSGAIHANGFGFRGGIFGATHPMDHSGQQGESYTGIGMYTQCCIPGVHPADLPQNHALPNGGGGGGGGDIAIASGPGGGGGYGSSGQMAGGSGVLRGMGGNAYGNADLSQIHLGSGGGGSFWNYNSSAATAANGGAGGGIVVMYIRNLNVAGSITSGGGNGARGSGGEGSGGGSGGSVKIVAGQAAVGTNRVTTQGGAGGSSHYSAVGGNGGVGRIRIEYCEQPPTGSTNPAASTQKLTCHIAERTGDASGRLNLPAAVPTSAVYPVQYGRQYTYTAAATQTRTLRVPAGIAGSVTLDALISGVGTGSVTFRLDVGNDGTWDWQRTQVITDSATLSSGNLAAAFNAYWQTHGAPATGTLDVPVRVQLSTAGQALLTNLQINGSGSKVRHVRMAATPVTQFNLDFSLGGTGSGLVTVALDVGADGTIDWTYSGGGSFPRRLLTADLKDAVNAYLAGKSGSVDVPFRFFIAPDRAVTLHDTRQTTTPVVDLAAAAPSFGDVSAAAVPSEGQTVPVSASLTNPSSRDSGPLTAAFYAEAPGWGDWYIGSAFVANIPAGGSVPVSVDWNTTGFFGTVAVKVVVNPYGRTAETGVTNNVGTASIFITPAQKQSQTIAFGALPTRTLGDPAFTVTATASSGLAVAINSSTPAVCTVNAGTVTLLTAGTCTLVASQTGDGIYDPAGAVEQSFTVRAPTSPLEAQTITFANPGAKTLGDAPFALSASATSGLPVSFSSNTPAVCTVSGSSVTLVAVGTCTLTATQAGNTTYAPATAVSQSFAVNAPSDTRQVQTIAFANPGAKTLGDAPFALSASATSGLPVSFATDTPAVCTVSGSSVTLVAVGTCTLTAAQAGNANYHPAAEVQQSFAVVAPTDTRQVQTIAFANPGAKTLGDAPFALEASATSGLPVSFTSDTPAVCTVSGSTVTLVAVGTCTLTASQAGNTTYAPATAVSQSFAVNAPSDTRQVQTIAFANPGAKTLGDAPFALSASATSGLSVSFTSDTPAVCTVSGSTVTLVAVGTCTLTASQAGNANFLPAAEVMHSFAVVAPNAPDNVQLYLPHMLRESRR